MSVNVYNVIWADDECDTLKKDISIRKLFNDYKIEVLCHVPTSEELKDAIERFKDKIDAIIVDGNFSKEKVAYIEPTDISGLIHTLSFIELFNVKRDIPFFLYTGRKVMLQEICKNGELDYFVNYNRIIQKGNIGELANKIVNDVDRIHSIEWCLKKKYRVLLNFVEQLLPGAESLLWDFLLNEARDITFKRTELMFNDLRNILEKVVSVCRELEITPDEIKTLNNFKHYWSGKYDKIEWVGPTQCPMMINRSLLMPKVMSSTLWSYIDILQDGSHSTEDLKLYVREYVSDTKSPFLFRTCLYQTLDILRWLKSLINDIKNGTVQVPLYKDKY